MMICIMKEKDLVNCNPGSNSPEYQQAMFNMMLKVWQASIVIAWTVLFNLNLYVGLLSSVIATMGRLSIELHDSVKVFVDKG